MIFFKIGKFLSKNFDNINNNKLAYLELYIIGTCYLEKVCSHFTEVLIEHNKVETNAKELEPIFDAKKEKRNKKNGQKE